MSPSSPFPTRVEIAVAKFLATYDEVSDDEKHSLFASLGRMSGLLLGSLYIRGHEFDVLYTTLENNVARGLNQACAVHDRVCDDGKDCKGLRSLLECIEKLERRLTADVEAKESSKGSA